MGGARSLLLLLARAGSFGEAAWRSWFAAAGFFVTLHHWVLPYLGVFSVVAAGVVGLVWVPVGLAAYGLLRRPSLTRVLVAMLVLPSVWLTVEVLRSWKHLGGAWGSSASASGRWDRYSPSRLSAGCGC